MEPITERELDVAGANRVIERLRIQQLDNGRFSLIVKLTWRETEQTLISQRKKVRGWVSLGLLLEYIKKHYRITSDINITLSGDKL